MSGELSARAAMDLANANRNVDKVATRIDRLISDTYQGKGFADATTLAASADLLATHPQHSEKALRGYEVASYALRHYVNGTILADLAATSWAALVAARPPENQQDRMYEISCNFCRNHTGFLADKLAAANAAKAPAPAPAAAGNAAAPG